MDGLAWVDELFTTFTSTLPEALRPGARGLAHRLALAPNEDVPWSQVFGHEVTLTAPALVAEAMPSLGEGTVRDAVAAHTLALIEAFATDRIEDGQVDATADLVELLARVRAARDAAIARVAPGAGDPALDYARAERETLDAIHAERGIFARGDALDTARYRFMSHASPRAKMPRSAWIASSVSRSARA